MSSREYPDFEVSWGDSLEPQGQGMTGSSSVSITGEPNPNMIAGAITNNSTLNRGASPFQPRGQMEARNSGDLWSMSNMGVFNHNPEFHGQPQPAPPPQPRERTPHQREMRRQQQIRRRARQREREREDALMNVETAQDGRRRGGGWCDSCSVQ